jgi:ATP-binding cassette subfamily A (ABC1) protein 3
MGLVFVNAEGPGYEYKIRGNTTDFRGTSLPATDRIVADSRLKVTPGETRAYIDTGFVLLQQAVEDAIRAKELDEDFVKPLWMSSLMTPTEAHTDDAFWSNAGFVLPIGLLLGYAYPFSRILKEILIEKENKIKEGTKMMGMQESAYWMSWLITSFLTFTLTNLLAIIATPLLFENSSAFVFWLVLETWTFGLIGMAFLLSVLIPNSKNAALFAFITEFGLGLAYFSVGTTWSQAQKNAICLLAPICFSLAGQSMADREAAQVGATLGNLDDPIENAVLGDFIGMMTLCFCLYFLLSLYLDRVMPSEWGTTLPWYFPFTKCFVFFFFFFFFFLIC